MGSRSVSFQGERFGFSAFSENHDFGIGAVRPVFADQQEIHARYQAEASDLLAVVTFTLHLIAQINAVIIQQLDRITAGHGIG